MLTATKHFALFQKRLHLKLLKLSHLIRQYPLHIHHLVGFIILMYCTMFKEVYSQPLVSTGFVTAGMNIRNFQAQRVDHLSSECNWDRHYVASLILQTTSNASLKAKKKAFQMQLEQHQFLNNISMFSSAVWTIDEWGFKNYGIYAVTLSCHSRLSAGLLCSANTRNYLSHDQFPRQH